MRHPELVAKLPGVRRYVQGRIVRAVQGENAAFDGVGEAWFDDATALMTMLKSPAYAALLADEAAFLKRSNLVTLVVEDFELLNQSA